MKHLTLVIRAELEIPDDWTLVEHPSGMQVLRVGNQFIDFDLAPLATTSAEPNAEWSDADNFVIEQVLDAVTGLDVELEVASSH
jgi:hypothetical protein